MKKSCKKPSKTLRNKNKNPRHFRRFIAPVATLFLVAFFAAAGAALGAWQAPTVAPPDGNAPGFIYNQATQQTGNLNISGNGTFGGLCFGADCKYSWSQIGGFWAANGNDIYNANSGNVAIGSNNPNIYKLYVLNSTAGSAAVYGDSSTLTDGSGVLGTGPQGVVGIGAGSANFAGYFWASGNDANSISLYGLNNTGYGVYMEAPKNYFSGNVGIGTNAPKTQLDVAGTFQLNSNVVLANSYQRFSLGYGAYWDNANSNYAITDPTYNQATFSDENGNFVWTLHSGALTSPQTYAQWHAFDRMVLTANGNLGIARTPDPAFILDIGGNNAASMVRTRIANTNAANSADILVGNFDGTNNGYIRMGSVGGSVAAAGAFKPDGGFLDANANLGNGLSLVARATTGEIRFYSGGSDDGNQRMTITSAGNVGIGVTAPDSNLVVAAADNYNRSAQIRATGGWGGGSNSLFFGHNNTQYLAALGSYSGLGYPFIAFYSYHGDTGNTLKRASAANKPSVLDVDTNGLLQYKTAPAGAIDSAISDFTTKFAITNAGNVGIGTTAPTEKLNVSGNILATGTICGSGGCIGAGSLPSGTNGQTLRNSSGSWVADSNLINNGTNVGIGVSPSFKLDINGRANIRGGGSAATTAGIWLSDSANTQRSFIGMDDDSAAPKVGIYNNTAWRLIVDSSGNVGIGTTAPLGKLSVGTTAGNSVTLGQGDPASGMWIRNDGSNTVISTNVGNMYYGYNGSSKNLYFMPGGTGAAMTITTAGNVGIGTNSAAQKLDVAGNINLSGATANTIFFGTTGYAVPGAGSTGEKIQLYGTAGTKAASDYAIGIESSHMWFNASSGSGFKWYTNSAQQMVLNGSGNLGIGTTAPAGKLDVNGDVYANRWFPRYSNWVVAGAGGAGIVNSNEAAYQALMIVGNNSGGGERKVKVWDDFTVASDINAGGVICDGGGRCLDNVVNNLVVETCAWDTCEDRDTGLGVDWKCRRVYGNCSITATTQFDNAFILSCPNATDIAIAAGGACGNGTDPLSMSTPAGGNSYQWYINCSSGNRITNINMRCMRGTDISSYIPNTTDLWQP